VRWTLVMGFMICAVPVYPRWGLERLALDLNRCLDITKFIHFMQIRLQAIMGK
jgi:hypothetical protein